MITNSKKVYNIEKIKEFNKAIIEAAKTNKDIIEFEGNEYTICSNGVYVQTLVNGRILYRIFIEEHRNNICVYNDLLKHLYS